MNAPLNPYAILPAEAVQWLANGQRGVSSNSFISAIYGIDALGNHYRDAPYDPADFRRCRLMVDSIPGAKEQLLSLVDIQARPRARLAMLKVVENWELLCAVMDAELPTWRNPPRDSTCPRLYVFMRQLWAEADVQLAVLPENERGGPVQGRDLQDYRAVLERRTLPRVLTAQVQSLMEMHVVDHNLNGRTAFALMQEVRLVIERMAKPGSYGATNDRIEAATVAMTAFDDPRALRAPRGKSDGSAVCRILHKGMDFLWRESRGDAKSSSNDYAKSIYGEYMRLKGMVEKAVNSSQKPSTPVASLVTSKPRA